MARQKHNRFTFQIPELTGLDFPWYTRMTQTLWRPLRQYVYQRDNGKCRYCDTSIELYACHCHHVLELNQGGTNHPDNLKTACIPCHEKKHPFMKAGL